VVITSPEAANVFLQGWQEAGKPQVLAIGYTTTFEHAIKSMP